MNIRVVTFLSSDDEAEIKELVADFCESLIKRGFANEIEDDSKPLKSVVVVKENLELMEVTPDDFFAAELSDSLMTVIPTDEQPTEEETTLIRVEEDDAA